jgi:hypothetical protein
MGNSYIHDLSFYDNVTFTMEPDGMRETLKVQMHVVSRECRTYDKKNTVESNVS